MSVPFLSKTPDFPRLSHIGESLRNTQVYVPVDVRAALAFVFGSHPILCFLEYPVQFQFNVPL